MKQFIAHHGVYYCCNICIRSTRLAQTQKRCLKQIEVILSVQRLRRRKNTIKPLRWKKIRKIYHVPLKCVQYNVININYIVFVRLFFF